MEEILNDEKLRKDKNDKSVLSEKETLNIINDIFLTNYWCTRKDMINITSDYIVGLDEINEWINFFNDINFIKINYIYNPVSDKGFGEKFSIIYTPLFLKNKAKPIYDILNIGDGKISLCGEAIISILKGMIPNNYDLFFHSDSVDEVDDIFNKCMYYLDNLETKDTKDTVYSRSHCMMNIYLSLYLDGFHGYLQFHKKVYKTKEQILFGFDLAPSRLGYNPKDDIFATICGAMAFSMNAFTIDSSNRNDYFGSQLKKYTEQDYKLLVPQLENNLIYDNDFKIFDDINLKRHGKTNRYNIISVSDNSYLTMIHNLDYLIKKEYENLTFSSDNLQTITELSEDFIEREMIDNMDRFIKLNSVENITRKQAKNFLDDKYKEFVLAYYIDENDINANAIWCEKVQYYINVAKKYVKDMKNDHDKNYYKGWKYLNPGSKYFGQNYPSNNPPTKYYKPLIIGIDINRFQAFMDCRKNVEYISNLPKEIFRLICEFWLEYEANDARNRLLMLKKPPIANKTQFNWNKKITCDIVFS